MAQSGASPGREPRDDFLSSLLTQVRRAQTYFAPTANPITALSTAAEVSEFVEARLGVIRELARTPGSASAPSLADEGPLPVFTYWNSEIGDAPPVVQACLAQLLRVHPQAHVLNGRTARELIDIPPIIAARLERDRPAHFSDYLRVALLERHGGIWLDATCFVPQPLTDQVTPLLDAGVLYPRWSTQQISNWFIAARAGNPMIAMQRAAIECWWTENEHLPDYFLYHRIFEALDELAPEVHRIWAEVPFVSTIPSHLLQLAMFRRYDPDEVSQILGASFVQKLSYKFDQDTVPVDSILARIISGQPLVSSLEP